MVGVRSFERVSLAVSISNGAAANLSSVCPRHQPLFLTPEHQQQTDPPTINQACHWLALRHGSDEEGLPVVLSLVGPRPLNNRLNGLLNSRSYLPGSVGVIACILVKEEILFILDLWAFAQG
jgi:hypothetical protein